MSQRYGGKYSPGRDGQSEAPAPAKPAAHPFKGKKRARAGFRVNLLFVVPFVFLFRAFTSDTIGLTFHLAAFGALILAAWLTREGVMAHDAYDARSVSRRPAIPRKLFGSAATGAGLACAALAGGDVVSAVLFAILGFGLHSVAFGIDPMRDKNVEGADRMQSDRVARAVDEAEKHLTAMSDAIRRTGDRALEMRVEGFKTTARDMFRTVEADPRDLTAARRYLGVYLLGARDAAVKYADLTERGGQGGARADFDALLSDLEANFAKKTETLLLDDRSDLDVEIEVLRERLAREHL